MESWFPVGGLFLSNSGAQRLAHPYPLSASVCHAHFTLTHTHSPTSARCTVCSYQPMCVIDRVSYLPLTPEKREALISLDTGVWGFLFALAAFLKYQNNPLLPPTPTLPFSQDHYRLQFLCNSTKTTAFRGVFIFNNTTSFYFSFVLLEEECTTTKTMYSLTD